MTDLLPEGSLYPDVEDDLCDWLLATYPATLSNPTQVGTETPDDLQSNLPFVRVEVIGGVDDGVTDSSTVDVEVFATTRAEAYRLAEDIRQRLLGYPLRVGTRVIDYVFTENKPRLLPWDVERTRRFGATYRISARR